MFSTRNPDCAALHPGYACYVKVAFFRGTSLRRVPPGESKQMNVRYLDIHEDDQLDEAQLAAWVKQASQLPGERNVSGQYQVRAWRERRATVCRNVEDSASAA